MISRKVKKSIYNLLIILALLSGLGYVCSRFVHLGNVEYTDNAQIVQQVTPMNTRVGGFISRICFEEYQPVHRGDTLVVIEDAEFQLRLAQAEADLSRAMAGNRVTHAGIATTQNNLSVSDAGIEEVRIQMENAQREWKRYEQLLAEESVTRQQYDQVRTAYESLRAKYEQASRAKRTTSLVEKEQTHSLGVNEAGIRLAEASVNLARLNLSYTVIVASCDGVTGKKDIHVGQLVQAGQTMVDVVDNSDLWVVANYRETQMHHIERGSQAEIEVDGVPNVVFHGEVEHISKATGAAYSLIPQNNATGNFVKVEQRVPVRIRLKGNSSESLGKLRAGYNVECTIKY